MQAKECPIVPDREAGRLRTLQMCVVSPLPEDCSQEESDLLGAHQASATRSYPVLQRSPASPMQINLSVFRTECYIHQKQCPFALVSRYANNSFCLSSKFIWLLSFYTPLKGPMAVTVLPGSV